MLLVTIRISRWSCQNRTHLSSSQSGHRVHFMHLCRGVQLKESCHQENTSSWRLAPKVPGHNHMNILIFISTIHQPLKVDKRSLNKLTNVVIYLIKQNLQTESQLLNDAPSQVQPYTFSLLRRDPYSLKQN